MTSKAYCALAHARNGFYVFPLEDNGKKPRTGFTDWEAKATTNLDKIRLWWQDWPQANIAIAAGRSGVVVIDIDPAAGGDVAILPLEAADLRTVSQATGGGGVHYFYRQPPGVRFGNANSLPQGIDSRGHGGYIVAPGSIHPDTGAVYTWLDGQDPASCPVAALPYALGQLLKPKDPPAQPQPVKVEIRPGNGNNPAYVEAAFKGELDKLSNATPNCDRNDTLNRAAFALGQLVAGGELNQAEVENALTATALGIGLGKDETRKTIRSGLDSGMKSPRTAPAPARPAPSPSMATNGDQDPALNAAEPPGPAKKHNLTDLGNARRLVDAFGNDIHHVPAWGQWLIWDKTRWAEDETGAIERLAKKIPFLIYDEALKANDDARPKIMKWGAASENSAKIQAMITLARTEPGIPIRHRDLDNQPFLLNCNNGTIDLETGQLRAHNRADLITKCLSIDYDPLSLCPLWFQFLDRVMGGNQELIDFIQRAMGYTLTGDVSEQCLFFLYGTGKNGKSVFSETLKALFGEYGQKAPTDMVMTKYGQNSIPNDVARLPGVRFVIVAEIEEGRRMAESLVKDLTGGDTIVARFLHQEFFEFEPSHKLWMYGNHKPVIRGSDEGIWRRIKTIPFDVTIPAAEQDPQLTKKLKAELPGILAWTVAGCREWFERGLNPPPIIEQATNTYRAEMDVLSDFLTDCCVLTPGAKVSATNLHQVYKLWCVTNGEKDLTRRTLGQRLRERGYETQKSTGGLMFWQGIGLRTEGMEQQKLVE